MDATGSLRAKITTIRAAGVPSFLAPARALTFDNFLRHSLTLTLATGVVNVANWLYHVVMSRALGPEAYGALSAIIGLLIIFTIPSNAIQMGVSAFVARAGALDDQPSARAALRRTGLRGFLLLGIGASLALALASPWLATLMRLSSPAPIVVAAGALVPWSVLPVLRGVLQGQQRPLALGASMAAESALKLAAAIVLVAMGYGVGGAVGGIVAGSLAALAATLLPFGPRTGDRGGAASPLAPLLRSVLPFAVAIACFTVLTQADVVLVKALFPARDAGLYAAASTGAKIVLYLTGALPMVMIPRLVRPDAAPDEARVVFNRTARYAGLAGGALVVAYFAAPRPVIGLLFGSAFLDAAPLLGPLGVAMLAYELSLLGIYYAVGVRRLSALRRMALPALAFPIAVWLFRGNMLTVVAVIAAMGLVTFALVWWSTTREVDHAAG